MSERGQENELTSVGMIPLGEKSCLCTHNAQYCNPPGKSSVIISPENRLLTNDNAVRLAGRIGMGPVKRFLLMCRVSSWYRSDRSSISPVSSVFSTNRYLRLE